MLTPPAMLAAALNALCAASLENMASTGSLATMLWPDEDSATGMAQCDTAGRAHGDTRTCGCSAARRARSSTLMPAKPGSRSRLLGSAGRAAQHPVAEPCGCHWLLYNAALEDWKRMIAAGLQRGNHYPSSPCIPSCATAANTANTASRCTLPSVVIG